MGSGARRGPWLQLLHWVFFAERVPDRRWTHVLPALATLLLATSINASCNAAGLYDTFEWVDLDRLQVAAAQPGGRAGITLVLITDREYEDPALFASTSPLASAGVLRILDAVCSLYPAAVGVDLLTSDWNASQAYAPPGNGCRVIWSHDAIEPDASAGSDADGTIRALRLGKVLGLDVASPDICSALPVVARDRDGIVRYYSSRHPVRDGDTGPISYEPTLAWALAAASGEVRCVGTPAPITESTMAPRRIRFTNNASVTRLHARHILQATDGKSADLLQGVEPFIKGKVVIIGGTYRHGRDVHSTPIGSLQGVEVIANAILTEANPIRKVGPWRSFLVDLAVGMGLFFIIVWLRLRWFWAIVAAALGAAAAAFIISWTLFNYGGFFLGVFGSLAGVVLGVVVDLSWEPTWTRWKRWLLELTTKWREMRELRQGLRTGGKNQ